MTKNELAEQVAERTGLSASQARQVVEAAIEVVSDELAAGGEVALAGFGKFSVSHRAARQGRNPSTGADDQHRCVQGSEVLRGQRVEEAPQRLSPGGSQGSWATAAGDPCGSTVAPRRRRTSILTTR